VRQQLRGRGIALDLGAARVRVRSELGSLAASLQRVYSQFEPDPPDGVFDATVTVRSVCGLRRLVRRQAELVCDGQRVFEPFPSPLDLPLLEWGLNYLIASRANTYLLLHAGVVEHAGVGIVLPAVPGSGKSTLVAALVCHGYRLLSDEFGVVRLSDHALLPLLRPVGLKNASIDLIERLAPDVRLGPRFEGTSKGTVAHLAPGRRSVKMRHVTARPGLILFPRFCAGAQLTIEAIEASRAFTKLAVNSFNHRLLGRAGFDATVALAQQCPAHRLTYSDPVEAIHAIDALVDRLRPPMADTGT
jgi:HprK-related kinase A